MFLGAVGVVLIAAGSELALIGGSPYYLLCGLAFILTAWLAAKKSSSAPWLFVAILIFTACWTVYEAGLRPWAMLPRLGMFCALGLIFAIGPGWGWSRKARTLLGAGLLSVLAVVFFRLWYVEPPRFIPNVKQAVPGARTTDWSSFGGDLAASQYGALNQINTTNIKNLKPTWIFRIGTVNRIGKGGLQATPIKVGNDLFICSGVNEIIAINASTGVERWRYDPKVDTTGVVSAGCRGVAYHRSEYAGTDRPCAERIVTNTVDARLIALDRRTGRPCRDFGTNGEISLLKGMGRKIPGYYYPTSAPTIANDKIIVGGWVTDNQYWGEPSGAIRAFDALSGKLIWAADSGRAVNAEKARGELEYIRSSPNSWGPMSVDEDLGLIYAPIGNPTPDYFGAQRRPSDEQIGSSVIALDSSTGKLRWVFQTVHHDLWDYDVPSAPTLVDLTVGGKQRKALVQTTKRGEVFLLDRVTGEPIAPVSEKEVPQIGAVPEEPLSPTQPFSSLPSLAGGKLTEARMWGVTPFDQLWCRIKYREARYDGPFTPPGLTPSITWPGYLGGTNWGGNAVDLRTGRVIINMSHVPNYTQLITRKQADEMGVVPIGGNEPANFAVMAQQGLPYAATSKPFLSPLGIPCNEPPFGRIAAIDLAKGELAWIRALGNSRDSGPLGIASGLSLPSGAPNTGGPLVTAGGLTFIGATQDASFRAFETNSGRLLWSYRLPAGGQATPMTYLDRKSGRQMVVISAGGNQLLRSKLGDYVIAFALPEN